MLKTRLLLFLGGIVFGILLVLAAGILVMRYAPFFLIVDEPVEQAEIAVVLGGGGGSRLRKGLSLYEAGLVKHLVLVDNKKNAWDYMLGRFCPDCAAEGKITIIEGSKNTFTDAELVEQYCRARNIKNKIKNVLVVTDPYHTRRASLIFTAQFAESEVQVAVVSSGDFGSRLTPEKQWWQDENTLKAVWGELSKVLIILLRKYEFCTH
ncbi:MAG: YdcF family protein [Candidatus Electrothrix sp. AX5]|nr:YdcF family protein [Candidatus Electrothrix sp. AX5]